MGNEVTPPDDDETLLQEFRDKVEGAVAELLLEKVNELRARGIADDRISNGAPDFDPDVQYIRVDDVPVYRAVVAFEEDGIRLFGSWIPAGLDRLDAN